MLTRLLLVLCLAAPALSLGAQVVETPEAFDAAGRVTAITPTIAADLQLLPPAWRITGDYQDARLYRLGNEGYVLVVTRRNGTVERYSITPEDREYLRQRTANLPPSVEEQLRQGLVRAGQNVVERTRNNSFIRNQTILGLTVYAPAFAAAISNEAAGRSAGYLLVAGGTFFGASTIARDFNITRPQERLSTHAAITGALAGWGTMYALDASNDATAAGIFVGGIGGTAAGLLAANQMNDGEVAAATFGSWAAAAATGVTVGALQDDGRNARGVIGGVVAAGLLGYPAGLWYARNARYNVTSGDVWTLWATGLLGGMAVAAPLADSDINDDAAAALVTGGFLAGVVAGDRLIVRRFDYQRGDGILLVVGTGAGALMGAGLHALIDREGRNAGLSFGLGALGGAAGLALSHYYLSPVDDSDRFGERIRFNPSGAAMAAVGVQGAHPIFSLTF